MMSRILVFFHSFDDDVERIRQLLLLSYRKHDPTTYKIIPMQLLVNSIVYILYILYIYIYIYGFLLNLYYH